MSLLLYPPPPLSSEQPMQAIFGIMVLVLIAWLLSENRKAFSWRFVLTGLAFHFGIAAVLLKVSWVRGFIRFISQGVEAIAAATKTATSFVFGYIGGGDPPFTIADSTATLVLGFQVLPQIIVLSVLFALLWHWRVLPIIIKGLAWSLERFLNISGVLGLGAASSVFLGMIEAPMIIRTYLVSMNKQEFFALMVCGMATISGTVMVFYGALLGNVIEDAFGHVLTASVIAVPAALTIARIMAPAPPIETNVVLPVALNYRSNMDAILKGAESGLQVFLSVLTMLIVFVALVALGNALLGLLPHIDASPLTIQRLLGWALAPIAWCMGLPFEEAIKGGELLGVKLILTEFVAFIELSTLADGLLSDKSFIILVYGLTGFANFASMGIMIGGLTALVKERQDDIMHYAPRALVAGTLVSCLSGAVVGLLI